MFIQRKLAAKIRELSTQFPLLALLGPRQSGKTTLAKACFPNYHYVNLEELDARRFALEDPKGFLEHHTGGEGLILDEIQQTPDLLSYLQVRVDREQKTGFYILTGSQNILLNQHISQTLAGRIAIQTLLPLSIGELQEAGRLPENAFHLIFEGFYPSLYAKKISPNDWYKGYIQTYVERDVRQIRNVSDLSVFQKFLKLCAGRIGQLVDLTSLGNDCGVSLGTIKAWLSILEASYIIFLLQPHYKNFSKRLIKSPKLYFYDPGLACHLLGIESTDMLVSHYLRGGLFESMVIVDLIKRRLNAGKLPNLYFWRDKTGLEVDCLIEKANELIPVEIKSAQTINSDFFEPLNHFCQIAKISPSEGYIVYGGDEIQRRQNGSVVGWRHLSEIPE